VLEYCDRGSLRDALDGKAFYMPDGTLNYCAVLDTTIDLAKAMIHLHTRNVLHSDFKARNIMLKSSGSEGRGVVAKVADFGLSVKMDHMETHLSNAFQVRGGELVVAVACIIWQQCRSVLWSAGLIALPWLNLAVAKASLFATIISRIRIMEVPSLCSGKPAVGILTRLKRKVHDLNVLSMGCMGNGAWEVSLVTSFMLYVQKMDRTLICLTVLCI
jgi:serine/threonine protein kinase